MEKKILTVVLTLLFAILGWIWTMQYGKLVEIEKSLTELKIEVSKMQVQMVTIEEVKTIVQDELAKHGIR